MIELNIYQQAYVEIAKAYFRYNTMEVDELVKSNIQEDVNSVISKWCKITIVSETRKALNCELKKQRNNHASMSEIETYILYQTSLAWLLGGIEAKCLVDNVARGIRLCDLISVGQEKYYSNHFE